VNCLIEETSPFTSKCSPLAVWDPLHKRSIELANIHQRNRNRATFFFSDGATTPVMGGLTRAIFSSMGIVVEDFFSSKFS
jgi:hypothetical protein